MPDNDSGIPAAGGIEHRRPGEARAGLDGRSEAHHALLDARITAITERLTNALGGIASCATACGCCRMHRQIALDALAWFEATTKSARDI